MTRILVTESSKDDLRTILRADDLAISGGDIAFAGAALSFEQVSSVEFFCVMHC
jgi:hypothetical protein